jgi:SAM-dependent methyltransferase
MTNEQEQIRLRLTGYLKGSGIEIGALHKPLKLRHPARARVRYVDRLPVKELRRQYPELDELPLVPTDLIDDGAILSLIPDASLNFIIANHLIEHLDNPLEAIKNWSARLKIGGIIFMAVPDQRFTFDRDRTPTTLAHLIEDQAAGDLERIDRNYQHFVETAEIIEKRSGEDARQRVDSLIARQYAIHYHTWTYATFQEVLKYCLDNMQLPLEIIDFSPSQDGGDEFIFILRKKSLSGNQRLLGLFRRR